MSEDPGAPLRGRPISGHEPATELLDLPEPGLGAQAASGVLWTTAQKWLLRLSGLATLAILTRLITPQEFGVVAAAMTVLPFLYLIADLGFSTYLVQAERVDQRMLSTGLWFSLTASAVLVGVMYVTAPLIASVLSVPEVIPVLRVLSLSVLASALSVVPLTVLKRRMAFRLLAVQGAIAGVVAQGVAVVMAFSGAGVWTLVAQQLVSQGVALALAWRAARWRPSLQFSIGVFKSMATFGVRVSSVEIVAVARSWAETAIIVSTLGVVALGYLSIAQRLVQTVQDLGASAILPVSVVVFSRIRESRERLVSAYLRATAMAYTLVSPLLAVVAVGAPVLGPLLFGDQWSASVPVAQALAIAAILTLGAMLDHGLFYGLGRPGIWLVYAVAIDAITVAATAVVAKQGLVAVAVAFIGVAFVATAVRWFLVGKVLHRPTAEVASPFALAATATTVSMLAGYLVAQSVTGSPALVALALTTAAIGISHLVVVRVLQRPVLSYCLDTLPIPVRFRTPARRLLCLPDRRCAVVMPVDGQERRAEQEERVVGR
jgi:O-antigen/teichoic acid export membrane protein